jgi:uncharacterized protein YggE
MQQRSVRVAGAAGLALALAVGGVALALAVSNPAADGSGSALCSASAPKLTVQGSGEASASPDLVTLSIGINVTDSGAQASLVDDNSKANAVTTALERGGVAAKDIQTTDVSIQPQYNFAGTITGYQMANTITAKLRNFATAGAVVDAAASAAGNAARIDSLSFSIEDPRKIEDRARTDAVHQAVSHARSMARAAGERLGPVCSLADATPLDNTGVIHGAFAPSAAAADAVPLQPGTQDATAQITMVYALEPPHAGA